MQTQQKLYCKASTFKKYILPKMKIFLTNVSKMEKFL